jgi:hypothetical protein
MPRSSATRVSENGRRRRLRTLRCSIEQLVDWHPRLYLEPHVVACASMLGRYSASPARIIVECTGVPSRQLDQDGRLRLEIAWRQETAAKAARLRSTLQSGPLVEMAAVALALVLAKRVVDLGELDVTAYGDRADYRSLSASCVLEISGTTNVGELDRRHRVKIAQALGNPFAWDAYVVVCAFAEENRVRLSHHLWKGPTHA